MIHRVTEHGYEYPVYNDLHSLSENAKIIARTLKKLFKQELPGMEIICMGSSGMSIATAVALQLKAFAPSIHHLKKEGEKSHNLNVPSSYRRLIIVDDFISEGNTINEIARRIKRENVVAICLKNIHRIPTELFPNLKHMIE